MDQTGTLDAEPRLVSLQTSFIYTEALSPREVFTETQRLPALSPRGIHQLQTPFKFFLSVYSLLWEPVSPPCAPYQLPASPFPGLYLFFMSLCLLQRTGPVALACALSVPPLTFVKKTSSREASWRRWSPSQGRKQTSARLSS